MAGMRRIGLIGGMSWESTAVYYRLLNEGARARLGGLASAELVIHSVDFAPIAEQQAKGDWAGAGARLASAARGLEKAGAEALLLCTNTMHLVASAIQAAVSIPLLDLIDLTAAALKGKGAAHPLLLGTRFTMEHGFYAERMAGHGIEIRVPGAADREEIHRVIYEELCQGRVLEKSRAAWRALIEREVRAGADAVIFGCTEIGLLLDPNALPAPGLDTTALHAEAALDWATAPIRS